MRQLRVNVTPAELNKITIPTHMQDELRDAVHFVKNMSMLEADESLLRELRDALGSELVERRILEPLRRSGVKRIQLNVIHAAEIDDEHRVEEID